MLKIQRENKSKIKTNLGETVSYFQLVMAMDTVARNIKSMHMICDGISQQLGVFGTTNSHHEQSLSF